MKLTITTLVIIKDMEVQDVIHSLNEDPAKAQQEIVDQVNKLYSPETKSFTTIEEVLDSFTFRIGESQGKAYLNCQEIPLQSNGTVLKDITL